MFLPVDADGVLLMCARSVAWSSRRYISYTKCSALRLFRSLFSGFRDPATTRLMTLFSILALLLATLGLYGVTAYTVARRTAEIGIRMALGANRRSVVGLIMRGAMLQTAIGLAAIGIPVAWFCVRYIESQLYESKGMSFAVLAIATLTLTAAAALAGLIPAQRAASTNPSQALRTE
jgi:macrolide transport system ATP-binding/permease protein